MLDRMDFYHMRVKMRRDVYPKHTSLCVRRPYLGLKMSYKGISVESVDNDHVSNQHMNHIHYSNWSIRIRRLNY
jgi:hypothetical protein